MAHRTDWSSIGRISVLFSLTLAVVLFFALPDDRWIAGVLVGMAVLDGLIYTLVLPRLTGSETAVAPSLEPEAPRPDDDWGKREPGDV